MTNEDLVKEMAEILYHLPGAIDELNYQWGLEGNDKVFEACLLVVETVMARGRELALAVSPELEKKFENLYN